MLHRMPFYIVMQEVLRMLEAVQFILVCLGRSSCRRRAKLWGLWSICMMGQVQPLLHALV